MWVSGVILPVGTSSCVIFLFLFLKTCWLDDTSVSMLYQIASKKILPSSYEVIVANIVWNVLFKEDLL